MKYGMLLWPHANARYQQAMKPLAIAELHLLMKAASIEEEAHFQQFAGIDFLCFDAPRLSAWQADILKNHSQLYFFSEIRAEEGFFPVHARHAAYLGSDLPGILKYKGKTNESFTHLLINLALFSGAFAGRFKDKLHFIDPMCGRGTALYDAVNRGFCATGIDMDASDISEAYNFFKRYLEYHRFKHATKDFSMTVQGKKPILRRQFEFANDPGAFKAKNCLTLSLIKADAAEAVGAFPKKTFHLAAADLPYGVQHAPGASGKLSSFERMLSDVLGLLRERLIPGGALALSFNGYTLKKETLRKMLEDAGFEVMCGGLYDELEHWVEQAVMRDAVVGRVI